MRTLFGLLFLFVFTCTFSQRKKDKDTSTLIHQPNRIEFEIDASDLDFRVIGGEEEGLLTIVETNERSLSSHRWYLHFVDTTLTKVWSKSIAIPFDSYLTGTEYHDGKFYLLFNASRYHNEDLMLYEIDAETEQIETIEINTVFPIQLTFFEVLDDNIIFAGYTNFRPVLLTFNLDDQKPKVVPGFYDNNSDILDVIIDDDARMFTVIQSERMSNRKYTIRAKTFTSGGDLIQNNTIEPGEKKNLVDGASTIFYGGFQYMAGTFSKKSSEYSRGLYLSKFINGKQQFIKYHDYADLTNFFGYMNERREQRIKDRIERKRSKGKKPKFSYRLLVHDIIQRGDEYLMIAEAYYPRYSSYSTASSYGWNNYSRLNPNFMGYRYTHAIVVSFDRNGNIRWDNSFKIEDIETYGLEKFVAVSNYENKTVLMYLEENTIRSKVISGDEILEGKTFNPVRLSSANDQIKSRDPEVEGLKVWYDKTMYAFGEQRIKNDENQPGRINRKVFYINKIQYHFQDQAN